MSRFARKDIIPISDDQEPRDIVYVHAQSTLGMERRINKRFMEMKGEAGAKPVITFDPTEYNFAMLCEFIVRWEGPGFDGRPFSEAALAELDADDPLIAKVLAEIQGRNPKFADTDEDTGAASPNSPTPEESGGSASSEGQAKTSAQRNGTGTLSLPKGTAGSRKK